MANKKILIIICVLVTVAISVLLWCYLSANNSSENSIPKDKKAPRYGGLGTPLFSVLRDNYVFHGFYPKKFPLFFGGDNAIRAKDVVISDKKIRIQGRELDYKLFSETEILHGTVNSYLTEIKYSYGKVVYSSPTFAKTFDLAFEGEKNIPLPGLESPSAMIVPKKKKSPPLPKTSGDINDRPMTDAEYIKAHVDTLINKHGASVDIALISAIKSLVQSAYSDFGKETDMLYKTHRSPLVRVWVVWAFVKMNCKDKVPLLEDGFALQQYPIVKLITIRAVIELGGKKLPEHKEYILEQLATGEWESKVFAIEALGAFGEESAETLIKCLHDKDQDVRTAAMLALAKAAPGKAIKPLFEAYKVEDDIDMKYNAWFCLSQCIDPRRNVLSLKEFDDKEKEITTSLEKIISEKEKTKESD